MQAYVDDVALAAATELDQQSDSLTRAFRAACGTPCSASVGPLVSGDPASGGPTNAERFATSSTLTLQKVTFLSVLGADPGPVAATPAAGDTVVCTVTLSGGMWVENPNPCIATASLAATVKFVEVQAEQRTVNYVILPVVNALGSLGSRLSANNEVPTPNISFALRATAGFKRQICNAVPLMVCNPAEIVNGSGAEFRASDWVGKQIAAKISGSNAGWTPGNFGLTNNFPGTGANQMEEAMANVNPFATCEADNVGIKNGATTGKVADGMNVRFDLYNGDEKSNNSSATYPPAPAVVKGLYGTGNGNNPGSACNPQKSATSMPMPRDNCFMVPPTPGAGLGCVNYPVGVGNPPRYGNGQWARNAYWHINHPGIPEPTTPVVTPPGSPTGPYVDATNPLGGWTRYQTYRYEIETMGGQVNIPGDEQGAPVCNPTVPDTNRDRDRRIIYVAVVNCLENGLAGNGGNPANIPVKAYAKVFITEPVGNTGWNVNGSTGGTRTDTAVTPSVTVTWPAIANDDFMVEIADVVKPNDSSGHLHVYPVLYR
jgi:hypothetical protein